MYLLFINLEFEPRFILHEVSMTSISNYFYWTNVTILLQVHVDLNEYRNIISALICEAAYFIVDRIDIVITP